MDVCSFKNTFLTGIKGCIQPRLSLFPVEFSGEGGIRTRGSVRHRFGLFASENWHFLSQSQPPRFLVCGLEKYSLSVSVMWT